VTRTARRTPLKLSEHFFWTLIVVTAVLLGALMLAYVEQRNDPSAPAPVVCQANWNCTVSTGTP
jgi:hypothetical protein